jgi:hypothetical protein
LGAKGTLVRLLLAWVVAQALGGLATFFSYLGGAVVGHKDFLAADRLVWLGLTLTGFTVFDFARRATSGDAWQVKGAQFAWVVSINALIMLGCAGVFGVLAARHGLSIPSQLLPVVIGDDFILAVAAAFFVSVAYVLMVEMRLMTGGWDDW